MITLPSPRVLTAHALAINIAFADSGTIRETDGYNRSPEIDKIESLWGMQGESYCVMGAFFTRFKALANLVAPGQPIDVAMLKRMKRLHEQNFGACPTGCTDTISAYKPRSQWNPLVYSDDAAKWQRNVSAFLQNLQPGDNLIYDWTKPGGELHRHFATFIAKVPGELRSKNVEWNTSPEVGSGNQDNGDGCYVKHRDIDRHLMGSVRFNIG